MRRNHESEIVGAFRQRPHDMLSAYSAFVGFFKRDGVFDHGHERDVVFEEDGDLNGRRWGKDNRCNRPTRQLKDG